MATKVTNALGHVSYTQYDYYMGRAVNAEDANGKVSSVCYRDSLDRKTKTISAYTLRHQTILIYDVLDNLLTVIQTRTLTYDSLGRLAQATNPESMTEYEYDNVVRITKTMDPLKVTTSSLASVETSYSKEYIYDRDGLFATVIQRGSCNLRLRCSRQHDG